MSNEPIHNVHCTSCDRITKHYMHANFAATETVRLSNDGVPGFHIDHEYMIVQCAGCEHVTFIDAVPSINHVTQYPEPIKKELEGLFLPQGELFQIPNEIADLYEEISKAYRNQTPILCGVGLRVLVEAICIDRQIAGSNLLQKVKGLKDVGLISAAELPILDKLRNIGNAAAHEIKVMDEQTLKHALLIINHIIRSIYILPGFGAKINL